LSAQELIKLVENDGALVIWDGLDEVLVHLDPNPARCSRASSSGSCRPQKRASCDVGGC